jgi:CBS-domain-containing membrane protein
MPIADHEKRKAYHRDYWRYRRSGGTQTGTQTPAMSDIPSEYRLATAADILDVLGEQLAAILEDTELGSVERARTIGYLAGIMLKAIETTNMAGRLEALEAILKKRSESN